MRGNEPAAEEFQRALPDGWRVEISSEPLPNDRRGHVVTATHGLFGRVSVGPKLRLVPLDIEKLADRVRDAEAPPLSYSQWVRSGVRHGYLTIAEDAPLPRALRLLAICIERGDVEASDVARALLANDTYAVDAPVAEASVCGADVSELMFLLGQAAVEYGYEGPDVNAPHDEATQTSKRARESQRMRVAGRR